MELKAGYKQTEVGVIPEDWAVKQMGQFGTLTMGKGLLKEDIKLSGCVAAIPYTALYTDFNEVIDYAKIKWFVDETSAPYVVNEPCVLIASSSNMEANTGKAAALPDSKRVAVGREVITFKSSSDSRYVSYLLSTATYRRKTLSIARGTTIKHLYPATFVNYVLALPPHPEQEAIAEALSDADALIESLDQLITKKRHLKQGAMQELLTGKRRLPGFSREWEVKRLGDISEIIMGQSPSSVHYNNHGDGLPLIQGNADIFERKTIKRVFTRQINKHGRCGDILLSVRAPVGEVAVAVFDVCLGRGVCAVRFPNDFLYHALIAHEPAWAKLSKGSTFDSVNSIDVKNFVIEIPKDIAEQTAIATILSDMDTELAELESRVAKARQIKQGMMQELLTGRIRLK